ncbi:MAG: hypothetical protein ABII82_20305 [Verrucomicrobiota bacterium]
MKTHSQRGEATVILIAALAVGALGLVGGFKLGKSSLKGDTADLQEQVNEAKELAREQTLKAEAAQKAYVTVVASDLAEDQSTAGFALGTKIALDAEPSPSHQVRVAQEMNDQVLRALPAPTGAQQKDFAAIVDDMLANNTLTTELLRTKIGEADSLKAALTKAQADADKAHQDAVVSARRLEQVQADLKKTADALAAAQNAKDSLLTSVKLAAGILIGLWVASVVLPPLARSVPALQPVASVVGGLWSPGVQSVASGARRLSGDLVAFHEFTKKEIEDMTSDQALAEFKRKAKNWWGDDLAAQFAIERIKNLQLRT